MSVVYNEGILINQVRLNIEVVLQDDEDHNDIEHYNRKSCELFR